MIKLSQQVVDLHKLKGIVRLIAICLLIVVRYCLKNDPDKMSEIVDDLQSAIDELDEMM